MISPRLMNKFSHRSSTSCAVPILFRCCAVLASACMAAGAQTRILPPAQPQPSPIAAVKRPHVATLRSSDSTDGSRVALTSDQSLRDYEAYRRGDRFYVRIPAADVQRAAAVRGRAFADVKAQQSGDSTLISFRLQPGATAHVEQRANRLDILIAMPGARPMVATANPANNPASAAITPIVTRTPAKNSGRENSSTRRAEASRATPTPRELSSLTASATPQTSPTPRPSEPAIQRASPVVASNNTAAGSQPPSDTWSRLKARVHYWILLAQLNPIPVSVGVVILLMLIGFLFYQRRGKSGSRSQTDSGTTAAVANTATDTPEAPTADLPEATTAKSESRLTQQEAAVEKEDAGHRANLISQVDGEARKLLGGGEYDREVIASADPDTRRLVSAELLSALVGRNADRRERARAAFMDHGYFEDATRDLRTAESVNDRAAAARRLSFVRAREATPHLIAALSDSSPDVRRAAVEALMDIRDPAAISSLNSLMQSETDRKLPRTLIKHAIDACATGPAEGPMSSDVASQGTPVFNVPSQHPETEREVFEL